ncbi:butyrophilin subfamily 1 member A1-like [Acanthopagrus schlegelii]
MEKAIAIYLKIHYVLHIFLPSSAAAASPAISLAGIDRTSSGVVLKCESSGWYPEPEVFWLDGEGNLLSAGPTETVRSPDGLYTVSSRVTVEKRHSNSFTCRVQQNHINQTRETHIHVPDDFFMVPPGSAACITISLVACFTCVLAVVFVVWILRRSKTKAKRTAQREEQQLLADKDNMKEAEKRLADTLMNQRDQLKRLRTNVEKLVEDNESKLQSREKDMTNKGKGLTSAPDHKDIIYDNNWYLKDRVKELETMVLNTEKLLGMMKGVIVKTTEKEETEKQINEE